MFSSDPNSHPSHALARGFLIGFVDAKGAPQSNTSHRDRNTKATTYVTLKGNHSKRKTPNLGCARFRLGLDIARNIEHTPCTSMQSTWHNWDLHQSTQDSGSATFISHKALRQDDSNPHHCYHDDGVERPKQKPAQKPKRPSGSCQF